MLTTKSIKNKLLLILVSLTLGFTNIAYADSKAESLTKVVVATSAAPQPFTYYQSDGKLVGYDIEVIQAVFAKLPQYQVSYVVTEFSSVLAGLDSNRYQIGANNFAKNAERTKKYIYSDPIFKNKFVIGVAKDRNDINSFTDLVGKSTEVNPGLNYASALENFNAKLGDKKVIINYIESDFVPLLRRVASKQIDFNLIDEVLLNKLNKEFKIGLKGVELSQADSDKIGSPYSYFLINKSNSKLADDVNKVIEQLAQDGTLAKISKKYFDKDYSPSSW